MKEVIILFAHLLTTVAKLLGPGGTKAVLAENLIPKQQLLIVRRSHTNEQARHEEEFSAFRAATRSFR